MRFKEVVLENWGLKVVSVLLAFILWLFVHGDAGSERVMTVPLDVRIPRNMEITNERQNFVEVTVRGSTSSVWFGQPVPTCMIDLQWADEGEHVVPLTGDNIRLARTSGLSVVGIRPARVTITLERTVSKELAVNVATRGEPSSGYDVYSKSASPSSVIVSGPRSHVEGIKEISTETVSLSGQKSSIRVFVNLNIKDPTIHTSPIGPVEVDVQIGAHRRLYTVTRIPVNLDQKDFTVSPQYVSVDVLVPVTVKSPLTAADLDVTVSVLQLDLSQGSARARPNVRFSSELGPYVSIKDIRPREVTVRRNGKS